jgi:DNA repair exonuclease SbcCD ATPase subunit
MRFVRLSIEHFQVVRQLDVEFGPGINVLHGPNDLGKSTVAAAIRAALLVPSSGSEAESYSSWFSGVSPRVELTLVDGEERWWKVRKNFGSASASSAEMFHSKDGLTFALDCKGREVEERLRTLLAWGIPVPGGRGAPRGMPESFIANALLGGQDDADDILRQSLAADAVDTGKLRLTKALASLAQDPLFKSVLLRAQGEVDQFFTATGQRKRGQGSRFKQAGEYVRAIADELDQLKAQIQTSSAIENEVAALRQRHSDAQAVLDDAITALQTTMQRRERGIEREALLQQEAETKRKIDEIDAQKKRLANMAREAQEAGVGVDACRDRLVAASTTVEMTEAERRSAEEAVRLATGDEALRQQELRKAQLEKRAAELTGQLAIASSNRTNVTLAIEARASSRAAAIAEATAAAEVERATADRDQAIEKERQGAVELETSRALAAFLHWRSAVASREESAKAEESARRADADAATKDELASKTERELARLEKKFTAREAALPTSEQLQQLQELERALEKAEAALGGGINVSVRPRRPLEVTTRIDGKPPTQERLVDVREFAADRGLGLSIDEVAEIEITAGSAEARGLVVSLRQRWSAEADPVLRKASTANLATVVAAAAALQSERLASSGFLRSAHQLREDAKSLREQAALHRQRAGVAPLSAEEVEARRAAIGHHDILDLESHYAALKKPPGTQLEQLHQELAKVQNGLQEQRVKKIERVRSAESALAQMRDRAREAEEIHRLRVASLPVTDLDAQEAALVEQLRIAKNEQLKIAKQLESLAVEANRELEQAQQALAKTTAARDRAKVDEDKARAALDKARERHSNLEGAMGQFRETVDQLDGAAAEAAWKAASSALASIPLESIADADYLLRSEALVATARKQHAAVREELITHEGALAHVGGAALREEVRRLEEARLVAEGQQRALEVDADAWKLLRDTLRTVENEEGAHLGRALAGPVGLRFEELTGGRYRDLQLDASLKAEGLGVVGATAEARSVMEALSVGTRSQLAALVRLTIADQLRSAIVLDDHLVHTDVSRLSWFHDFLRKIAVNAQIVVITCRPHDYLVGLDPSAEAPVLDLAGGTLRAVDLGRVLQRHLAPSTP